MDSVIKGTSTRWQEIMVHDMTPDERDRHLAMMRSSVDSDTNTQFVLNMLGKHSNVVM
jgi:hypothetical protein